jgi:hypothetical protein
VRPRSLFLILVASVMVLSASHGQPTPPSNEDLLREIWRTSPDSQKISSDAGATQILPSVYSESGIDYISTLFIFPDHSYVETDTLLSEGGLWEEGSWRFDGGLIKLRSTWRRYPKVASPRVSVYLPKKISSDGAFGLFGWAKTFAENPDDLARYGYALEKPVTAAEIPALKKRFRHLRLLIEAKQQFMILGNADEEPPSGNQDMLVFKPDTHGLLGLLFREGGMIGDLPAREVALIPKRIEIPYDLQSVRLVGPTWIQGNNRMTLRTENDLIYSPKNQRVTGKDIEIRISSAARKTSN